MIAVPVTEASQVADVRRRAQAIAKGLGFGEVADGRVGIVATELATNLVKYGLVGEMLLGTYKDEAGTGVELIALDKGPGMGDLGETMRDGFSTAGSAGTGLGAIKRLCRRLELLSWPSVGTALLARVAHGNAITHEDGVATWGAVVVPLAGEPVSGDAICVHTDQAGWTVFVADGLGHGPQAAQASNEAVRVFLSVEHLSPPEILRAVHEGIRHTRGAAAAVCRYRAPLASLEYAGVGNIEGRAIVGGETKRLVSYAGTLGLTLRRVQSFDQSFPLGSVLVMHSDGLSATWSPAQFPGLLAAHPTLAAAVLYRHHGRPRDDASVVVAHAAAGPR